MDARMTSMVNGRAAISLGNTPIKKEGSKVSMDIFLYKTARISQQVTLLLFSAYAGGKRGFFLLSDERKIPAVFLFPQ